ncbi:MAG: 16S rRNA (cytidine(1402)-2'-O)-methyltransferase [Thermaerobacter sp.]|nr:16S rRNA (cytidine(1402)-2'-O)-methyltransferase [Thermaerobacter sp.]
MAGKLTVVPTPIGNLGDITQRATDALRAADVVFCEDTRRSGLLLHHLGVERQMRSLFLGNERERSAEALAMIAEGHSVALISDAGTPAISDPGAGLIADVIAAGYALEVLPGPQAILPALLLSGLPPAPFSFIGFLPRRGTARRGALSDLVPIPWTLVLYEAPHRLQDLLEDALTVLGDRPAAVVREISKLHEETVRGTISMLLEAFAAREVRGEIVVVVSGRPQEATPIDNLEDFVREALARGLSPKEVAGEARARGIKHRDAYREALRQGKGPLSKR